MTNPDNENETEEKLLPILEFNELIEIFEYTNERAARRAMRLDKFPVPTFEFAGRTVAHVDVIDLYFKAQRGEAIDWMKEKYGTSED